jgi:hypothetical protein
MVPKLTISAGAPQVGQTLISMAVVPVVEVPDNADRGFR